MTLDIIQVISQFFEELQTLLQIEDNLYNLSHKLSFYKGRKKKKGTKNNLPQKTTTYPFYQSSNLPYSFQKACRYRKNSGLRKQKSLLEEPVFFLCAFET